MLAEFTLNVMEIFEVLSREIFVGRVWEHRKLDILESYFHVAEAEVIFGFSLLFGDREELVHIDLLRAGQVEKVHHEELLVVESVNRVEQVLEHYL